MASRHLVALGSLVFVLFAFATISSCNGAACSDGGEGCSCTSPFDCDKFPSGCYRSYCDGTCHYEPFPAGSRCRRYPCSFDIPCVMGVCTAEFACVECVENSHCSAGHTCAPDNVCSRCDDGVKNGDETNVDCGGSCPLCPGTCNVDGDCPGGYCWNGACARCDDGIKNGDEFGVDCSGDNYRCPRCTGVTCAENANCASNACEGGICCATQCPLCYECKLGMGECVPVKYLYEDRYNSADPLNVCMNDYVCDGKGKCGLYKGGSCSQDDECASGSCVNGKCL